MLNEVTPSGTVNCCTACTLAVNVTVTGASASGRGCAAAADEVENQDLAAGEPCPVARRERGVLRQHVPLKEDCGVTTAMVFVAVDVLLIMIMIMAMSVFMTMGVSVAMRIAMIAL